MGSVCQCCNDGGRVALHRIQKLKAYNIRSLTASKEKLHFPWSSTVQQCWTISHLTWFSTWYTSLFSHLTSNKNPHYCSDLQPLTNPDSFLFFFFFFTSEPFDVCICYSGFDSALLWFVVVLVWVPDPVLEYHFSFRPLNLSWICLIKPCICISPCLCLTKDFSDDECSGFWRTTSGIDYSWKCCWTTTELSSLIQQLDPPSIIANQT